MRQYRFFIIAAIFSFMPLMAFAQDLLVYYVVGNVTYAPNGSSVPLVMNTRIKPSVVITIPADCRVELLDVSSAKRYILVAQGKSKSPQQYAV